MLCQLCEDRLYLDNKNVSLFSLTFCIVLGLHYLCTLYIANTAINEQKQILMSCLKQGYIIY